MTTTFQQVTDSGRAAAAFNLGIYSQRICLATLSESLVRLHRDVPCRILELLLGIVRAMDHVHFSAERVTQGPESWTWTGTHTRSSFQREIEVRERELRDLTDMAIPTNSELRPLFEFGRQIGILRRSLIGSDQQQNEVTLRPEVVQQVLAQAIDQATNAADLERFGQIGPILQNIHALVRHHREVARLCRGVHIVNDDQPPTSSVEVVDGFASHLHNSVSNVLFERVVEADINDARDAWLYEQAQHGANCEQLVTALREKRKVDPNAAKWPTLTVQGVRDAISRYATRHDLPAISFPRGRPKKIINRR